MRWHPWMRLETAKIGRDDWIRTDPLDDSLTDMVCLIGLHERNTGWTAAAPDGTLAQPRSEKHKGN